MTTPSLPERVSLLTGHDFWSTAAAAGVAPMTMSDGPHGVRRQDGDPDHLGINQARPATCFPPAVALGSSWDPALVRRVGQAVGIEARSMGVNVLLGPGINIKRSPLCGRNFEYFSEDPHLTGALGAAHVHGVQSTGTGASLKHFAANNQETDRMRVSADVDERTLREIYLPAFEAVVTEASPATVMTSYNSINGVPAAQNHWLLTQVLRQEWGYDGALISDWGGTYDRVAALKAGLDLEMPGTDGASSKALLEAIATGELTPELVDASVERLRTLQARTAIETPGTFEIEEHHALGRHVAARCAVLLKNDHGVLPLQPGARVAVIGELALHPRYQGGGSSHVNATRVDSPLEELALACGREQVSWARGYAADAGDDAPGLLAEAVDVARAAEVAVVFAGLYERLDSEGSDRHALTLPDEQIDLIRAVSAVAGATVVVLSNGGVVTMEEWHDDVDAILEGWLLGQAGGGAIADLLTGRANPSGRLAESIPVQLEDTASYINFPGEAGHVRYGEGVFVGYRWHTATRRTPRYPFGHGLSYTTFARRELEVTPELDGSVTVSVTVENTGPVAGRDVVQVYVAAPERPVSTPVRELRGFAGVELEPGQTRTVKVVLPARAFSYWSTASQRWSTVGGLYRIEIGVDADTVALSAELERADDRGLTPLTLESTVEEWFTHPVVAPRLLASLMDGLDDEARAMAAQGQEQLKMAYSMPMATLLTFPGATWDRAFLDELAALSVAPATAAVHTHSH